MRVVSVCGLCRSLFVVVYLLSLSVVSSFSAFFFFQAEDGIRDLVRSRGLGDVYKRQSLVGVTSTNHAPALRVVPGDPMASVLWHKVSQSTEYGIPMPPNETYLSGSELQTIRDWIEQGAMDN